ncbi:hypothetical protein HDU86_008048 [Geranomyces michiganensis]|nr:hypothetical protein HDU86_008048 [Geranomyces michiganensis]
MALSSNTARQRLAAYACRPPRPVRFQDMLKFGPHPHPHTLLATSRFLADEISVRLAHRHAELETLPYGLHATREAQVVRAWYKASFDELTGFHDELRQHWADPSLAPEWTRPWWQRKLPRLWSKATDKEGEQEESTEIIPRGLAATSAISLGHAAAPPRPPPPPPPPPPSPLFSEERYYTSPSGDDPPLPPHMLAAVPLYNKKFTTLLQGIVERHNPVVVTVSQNLPRLLPSSHPQHHPEVQAFLNRFHANRVGVRILIGHHLALSNPQSRRFPNHVGIVCTRTDTLQVAQEAAQDAADICQANFDGVAPPVEIVVDNRDSDSCELVYIPSHMHHILFELLKNSMRATMLKYRPAAATTTNSAAATAATAPAVATSSSSQSSPSPLSPAASSSSQSSSPFSSSSQASPAPSPSPSRSSAAPPSDPSFSTKPIPPVTITITPTPTQITIRVSDTGCGIPRAQLGNVLTYAYTTANDSSSSSTRSSSANSSSPPSSAARLFFTGSELQAPMAGFGYGLPLAKLYARYFKGDLFIRSVLGHGTDVDLVLRRDWAMMSEQVSM